jgi:hypothetical protein
MVYSKGSNILHDEDVLFPFNVNLYVRTNIFMLIISIPAVGL